MDEIKKKSLHTISDEIEESLKIKPENECQTFECKNLQKYDVKVRYGCGETDIEKLKLCYDCMKSHEKVAKNWAYVFSAKLMEGEKEPVIIKRRGRPKNLS